MPQIFERRPTAREEDNKGDKKDPVAMAHHADDRADEKDKYQKRNKKLGFSR